MNTESRDPYPSISRRRLLGLIGAGAVSGPLLGAAPALASRPGAATFPAGGVPVQSLDGSGNNLVNPQWGVAGTPYLRVAPPRYADGIGEPVAGPNARYVSNRIFNDVGQNLFSERRVSRWAVVYGQFLDHNFGLAKGRGAVLVPDPGGPPDEPANVSVDGSDPLEIVPAATFVPFSRATAAPGTGVSVPRQQTNLVSSYLDGWAVYGGTPERLEWLREGPLDGDPTNNGALLLLPGGYLPRQDIRGDAASAPPMEFDVPGRVPTVAGDIRAAENLDLLAVQTLFAREHNRIVGLLPRSLAEEEKFQIARRVVIAELQYIAYTQFLPAMGVTLPAYRGYNPRINASLGNEFAAFGYRLHSAVSGVSELDTAVGRYSPVLLDELRAAGVDVSVSGDQVRLTVPFGVGTFNPDLLEQLQLGPVLQGIGRTPQQHNDLLHVNQLRSIPFQIPGTSLQGVFDLAAIDVARGRDFGVPSYNQMRQVYGLPPKRSFREITGEASESFPPDPELTPGQELDDPDSLDFLRLFDIDGNEIALGSPDAQTAAVTGVRRTTDAARLKAIYGSVDNLDAFVGMLAEPHLPGCELGELQLAIWTQQFLALRDGDRFFYVNAPGLSDIRHRYGIDFRNSLGDLIAWNTDIPRSALADNVFLAPSHRP
jgi:Animal haem peroxidase